MKYEEVEKIYEETYSISDTIQKVLSFKKEDVVSPIPPPDVCTTADEFAYYYNYHKNLHPTWKNEQLSIEKYNKDLETNLKIFLLKNLERLSDSSLDDYLVLMLNIIYKHTGNWYLTWEILYDIRYSI